ncbi:Lrp/AsnC family transcriptional regulator [Halorhabdus salina]|uniref:Lrp/AsnC family transcriptional regulator n=1 Tax=Halorhabdus salina TaxID=2750670 RepID=UPI0015EFC02C|nr:Lrp/AsnC family transcriptional regulator [Halorhabdus salina]
MDLDETDRALVNALLEDSRASTQDLAAKAGVAIDVAERRIESLEDAGVIEGYTVRVDYDALGYDVTGLVRLQIDGPPDPVGESLGTYPWIRAVYEVTGADDFVVLGTFRDTDDMHESVAELLSETSIRSITVDVALNVVTEFEPAPIEDR